MNSHVNTPSFSQEGIKAVEELIQANDDLITIDLQDGFQHVPVNIASQMLLGIFWCGNYYAWTVLTFGLSCSPYFFHKTIRPVVKFLRENLTRIAPFVDDFLIMTKKAESTDHKDFTIQTFQDLGWEINFDKCELDACSSFRYLPG